MSATRTLHCFIAVKRVGLTQASTALSTVPATASTALLTTPNCIENTMQMQGQHMTHTWRKG